MKRIIQLCIMVLCTSTVSFAQLNTTLLGQFQYSESLSDVWHYAVLEKEYALVGVNDAFSIVDVTNPANPFEVANIPGASTIWRDIKTYQDVAYVTNEAADGLLIVDMADIAGGNVTSSNFFGNNGVNFTTAHNLYIDTDHGYCYIFGANYGQGGAIILDLNVDPLNPTVVGVYDEAYVHDGTVYDDIFYSAEINEGRFRLIDVTDKTNLVVLGQQTTTTAFCHNIWPSEDGQYVYTTDEVSDAYIEAYDVSDPTNILYLDRIQSNPGSGTIPHNAHWIDDFVVVSYYRDGLVIYDASNPTSLVEVGNYDHSSFSGNGFNGSWGANPYLPSGNMLSTDIEEGLFIIGFDGTRAAFLDGTVTDANSGAVIDDVQIEVLLSPSVTVASNSSGYYSTGFADSGTAAITFDKFGYQPYTEVNVNIVQGVTTTIDVQLTPLESFAVTGQVIDLEGNGVSGAQVVLSNASEDFNFLADQDGNFTIPNFFQDTYDAVVGQWGFLTTTVNGIDLDPTNNTITVELEEGYCDDFSFDFGWTASGTATTGDWVLGSPNGTDFNGTESNPGSDVSSDFGELCFTTGNGGGAGGSDDIDGGIVILTSPAMDLENYNEPQISFYSWFFNDGGQGTAPNDYFEISLTSATDNYVLQSITTNTSGWQQNTITLDTALIDLSSEMNLVLTSADDDPGHIVEAAFDAFKLIDLAPDTTGMEPVDTTDTFVYGYEENDVILSYQNPTENILEINYYIPSSTLGLVSINISDINGRNIDTQLLENRSGSIILGEQIMPTGIYIIHLSIDGVKSKSEKLIKL